MANGHQLKLELYLGLLFSAYQEIAINLRINSLILSIVSFLIGVHDGDNSRGPAN